MIEYKELRCEYYEVPKTGNYHIINLRGNQYWFNMGLLHRDNDKPAGIYSNGTQYWYQHGEVHRDNDLPAVITANGSQEWYQHGLRHRVNNPAIVKTNGIVEYWYDGKQYSKQQYFDLLLDNGLITEKEYFSVIL